MSHIAKRKTWFRGSYTKLGRGEREFLIVCVVGSTLAGLFAAYLYWITP